MRFTVGTYRCGRCQAILDNEIIKNRYRPDKKVKRSRKAEEFCSDVRSDRFVRCFSVCLAVVFCAIAAVGICSLYSRPDLTRCLSIESVGTNKYGKAYFKADEGKIARSVFGKKSYDELSEKEKDQYNSIFFHLMSTAALDRNGSLSNGDKIELTISGIDEITEKTGLSFSTEINRKTRVRGLDETGQLSASDLFCAKAVGYDGSGCIEITRADKLQPFSFSISNGKPLVDGEYELSVWYSNNAGNLKNGSQAQISLKAGKETAAILENKYGYKISDEPINLTAADLPKKTDPMFISLPTYYLEGEEGKGAFALRWKKDVLENSVYRISPDPDDNMSFELFSKAPISDKVFFSSKDKEEGEVLLGKFTIVPDKSKDIALNDEIGLSLLFEGKKIDPEALGKYGIICYCASTKLTATAEYFDRPLTNSSELDPELAVTYAADMKNSVQLLIKEFRPDLTDTDNTYLSSAAILTKPSPDSSRLKLWLIYTCPVNQSESLYVLCSNEAIDYNSKRGELIPKKESSFMIFDDLERLSEYISASPHDAEYEATKVMID
jgi:hypothetical protein